MFALFLGLIVSVVLFVVLGFQGEPVENAAGRTVIRRIWRIRPAQVLAPLVLIAAMGLGCVTVVPTGYTGILTTFGRVEERTISAGAHLIMPWQEVVKMDNRTQKVQIATEAFSSDIQQVNLQLSVNYCIDQGLFPLLRGEPDRQAQRPVRHDRGKHLRGYEALRHQHRVHRH